jgi:hypothetical protein
MRLLYVQVFAAVTAIGFVGSTIGLMSVAAAKREVERKLAKAEAELKGKPAPKGGGSSLVFQKKGGDSEKSMVEAQAKTIQSLSDRSRKLEGENEMLKRTLAELQKQLATAGAQKPIPGSAYGTGAPPPEIVVGNKGEGRDLAPPPPPEPSNEPWGASEDTELDEMAAALKLTPEQRDQTKKFIMDGQNEFERLLIEASNTGERDIMVIERIGKQVSDKTQGRIKQILFPEQIGPFEKLMGEKMNPEGQ